jgi:hypothetical protein
MRRKMYAFADGIEAVCELWGVHGSTLGVDGFHNQEFPQLGNSGHDRRIGKRGRDGVDSPLKKGKIMRSNEGVADFSSPCGKGTMGR